MSKSNFVICTRDTVQGVEGDLKFGSEPGPTMYLEVPDGEVPNPVAHKCNRDDWLRKLRKRAAVGTNAKEPKNPAADYVTGDILIFIHGYNNSPSVVMKRHDQLQKRLFDEGFEGVIVSFDWPSAEFALNYLEDRSDARATSERMVNDGIRLLAFAQRDQETDQCDIDIHLLGHSTGAYVIREAFYLASQSRSVGRINWNVSQIALIGGDIARSSVSSEDRKSQALFEHSARITNYQNQFDSALKLSNIKRLGIQPRIGRVGIPDDAPESVVNVNVGTHWRSLDPDDSDGTGNWSHSWHFDDKTFAEDLAQTLAGDVDRNAISTREIGSEGLFLVRSK